MQAEVTGLRCRVEGDVTLGVSRSGVGVNERVEGFAVPNFTCIFSGQRATTGLLSVAQ